MRTLIWIAFGLLAASSTACTTVTTESSPEPVSLTPWARSFDTTAAPQAIATGPDGDLFIGGSFYGTVNFGGGTLTSEPGGSLFMTHLDAQGDHLFSGATASQDQLRSVSIGPEGDMYVAGYYDGLINFGEGTLTGAHAGFLAAFEKEGASGFERSFSGVSQVVVDRVQATADGHVIIAARADDSTDFGRGVPASPQGIQQGVIVAYTRDAHALWEVRINGGQANEITMAVDAAGDVIVAGLSYSTISMGGLSLEGGSFLGKIDANGKPLWLRSVSDFSNNVPYIHDMATDAAGNVYFGGLYYGSFSYGSITFPVAQSQNAFFIKASPEGDGMFGKSIEAVNYVQNMDFAVSEEGEVVAVLTSYGELDFGKGYIGSGDSYDGFLARYSAKGDLMKATTLIGTGAEYVNDVALDAEGKPVIVGSFDNTLDFGTKRLQSTGAPNMFVARVAF